MTDQLTLDDTSDLLVVNPEVVTPCRISPVLDNNTENSVEASDNNTLSVNRDNNNMSSSIVTEPFALTNNAMDNKSSAVTGTAAETTTTVHEQSLIQMTDVADPTKENSDVLFSNTESGLGIIGSVTSLSTQAMEPLADSHPSPLSSPIQAQQQCVVCKRILKCKFNIVRDGDTKHLCTDVCFKIFRCNPTIYLDSKGSFKTSTLLPQAIYMPSNIVPKNDADTKAQVQGNSVALGTYQQPPVYSVMKCFKCQTPVKTEDLNRFTVTYMSGQARFCKNACFIDFVKSNRLCASCGIPVQGLPAALFVDTPSNGYMYFCKAQCKETFCNPTTVTAVATTIQSQAASETSNGKFQRAFPKETEAPEQQVVTIDGDDDVEIVGVTMVGEAKRARGGPATTSKPIPVPVASLNSSSTSPNAKKKCSVCGNQTPIKHTIQCNGKTHFICSESCLQAFKYANKMSSTICAHCFKVFMPSDNEGTSIKFEGETKSFCSNSCVDRFRKQRQKQVACAWCGVKKSNFDMVERVDANNKIQLFCTLKCLSLYRVNLQAMSNQSVACDQCKRVGPAQYHLTMSDASVRNFCSYPCVMSFQSQFSSPLAVDGMPQPAGAAQQTKAASVMSSPVMNAATTRNDASLGKLGSLVPVPIIDNVVSMASAQASKMVQKSPVAALAPKTIKGRTVHIPIIANQQPKLIQAQDSLKPGVRQLVVQVAKPKEVAVKALQCKPMTMTKATTCRPHTSPRYVQTDQDMFEKPILIPVPVPIFIPIPVPMYTTPTPYPVLIPVPLPIPLVVPTTAKTAAGVSKQIKEILESTPTNPYEADLLHMAEAVATAEKDGNETSCDTGANPERGEEEEEQYENTMETRENGDEHDVARSTDTSNDLTPDDVLHIAMRITNEVPDEMIVDYEEAVDSLPLPTEDPQRLMSLSSTLGKRRWPDSKANDNAKRMCLDTDIGNNHFTPANDCVAQQSSTDDGSLIKFMIGVNAWRVWVMQKNIQQLDQQELVKQSLADVVGKKTNTIKQFKTDPLQCRPDELACTLSMFVKEARKPNGEEYAPDTIFYFCLGLQQYLYKNGRIDNIFTDPMYEPFSDILNDVMQRYEIRLNANGEIVARIDEEHLWETKQLGAHSPYTLLATLIYFNTKYFLLKSAEEHRSLAFPDIMKHWKKPPGNLGKGNKIFYLRYFAPLPPDGSGKKKHDDSIVLEQPENLVDATRCPVKLYEFYLSKCPESVKSRSDTFYLVPERSCIADSPVWYTSQPVGVEMLVKMLSRLRVVRELQEIYLHDVQL